VLNPKQIAIGCGFESIIDLRPPKKGVAKTAEIMIQVMLNSRANTREAGKSCDKEGAMNRKSGSIHWAALKGWLLFCCAAAVWMITPTAVFAQTRVDTVRSLTAVGEDNWSWNFAICLPLILKSL